MNLPALRIASRARGLSPTRSSPTRSSPMRLAPIIMIWYGFRPRLWHWFRPWFQCWLRFRFYLWLGLAALLGGCAGSGGGYYGGDSPPRELPDNLDAIADAVPRVLPLSATGNRPYVALGKHYRPWASADGYVARGVASWYGQKFHGRRTSSGEPYDMFAMTAAHPLLPLPTFVRVTNLANGRAVVVKVNDRGPFLHGRIIDLSYAAAHKLGIAKPGTGYVEVRAIAIAKTNN